MKRIVLILAVFVALGASCCDPRHDGLAMNAANLGRCAELGGLAIVKSILDEGSHRFLILERCEFPCDKRTAGVEK